MPVFATLSHVAAGFYMLAVTLLAIYGLHSVWLLWLFLRHRREALAQEAAERATPLPPDAELPRILVQLPVFNERDVVERLVEAVGALDWPADRLAIQLLDDSTDDSVQIGRLACERLRARGLDAVSLHRVVRTGFKAGALTEGMRDDASPYIAIFDADFVPEPDFLRRAIRPLLLDDGLALVQGRWEHLNRHANLLTAAQSLGIDGHFAVEQGARAWSGLAMNFNGTCGLWRRSAILAAGGWEHDTLTEDMDLSYRAQLRGWRCTYRTGLAVPGEVPATVSAWRQQQFRWAKGSIQTAVKLLPTVWRSSWNLHRKLAATLHMTHYLVHPLILTSLFCAPLTLLLIHRLPWWLLMLGLGGFVVGAASPITVYTVSQFVLYGRRGWRNLRHLPALAALGTGIAVSNATAVWQALRGKQSAFVRTPKAGSVGKATPTGSYRARPASGMAELFCACWAAFGLAVSFAEHTWITPLLALYLSGFAWMAWFSMRERHAYDREHAPAAGPSPLPWLLPIGAALVAGYVALGLMPGTWRVNPLGFGGLALALGGLWLLAAAAVRARPGGRWTLAWIVAAAIGMRLGCLGLAVSDDVNRYLLEGRQIAHGQNPYLAGPLSAQASALAAELPPGTLAAVNHPDWTSIYPPATLAYEALVTTISTKAFAFKIAALLCELAALGLALATLVRLRLQPSLLLLAAWNPVGPLFLAGEGHNDAVLLLLLALGIYLTAGNHARRSLAALSLAALAKPFAAVALLPALLARSWAWWLLPPVIAAIAYLPFIDAGSSLFSTMGRFGTQLHFHGALEPLVRQALSWVVAVDAVQLATVGTLAAIWIGGSLLVLARWRRTEVASGIELTARLYAMLLACLPTLHAWYFAPLALLLPFTRSWGLALWVALAPMYWLHASANAPAALTFSWETALAYPVYWLNVLANVPHGDFPEVPWVTALAHLPALALIAYESFGRPESAPSEDEAIVPDTQPA
jgi:cellulose synthase/poly-beta-1,6-N-acetylglucosamine synthase-like glycosyltransferase